MGWETNGKACVERVGPVNIIAEPYANDPTDWHAAIVCTGGSPMLTGLYRGPSEEAAKRAARGVEVALLAVARWAATESDTETTRDELMETVRARLVRRDAIKREARDG